MLSCHGLRFLPYYAVCTDKAPDLTERPKDLRLAARKPSGCDIPAVCYGRTNGREAVAAAVSRDVRSVCD